MNTKVPFNTSTLHPPPPQPLHLTFRQVTDLVRGLELVGWLIYIKKLNLKDGKYKFLSFKHKSNSYESQSQSLSKLNT